MHLAESGRERSERSRPRFEQCISGIIQRVRDDVLVALSQHPPRLPDPWTGYMIVRSARRTCSYLLRFCSSSDGASPTEEDAKSRKDLAEFGHLKELLRNYEGKTLRLGSATDLVSPRRDGTLEGEMGPYIPSFSVTSTSTKEVSCYKEKVENLAMDAGTLGEVRIFESTESADEPTDPCSIFVRSERNQLTEPLESTDGSMYPARVELTETSERFLSPEKTRPLVVTALDMDEDSSGFVWNNSEAATTAVPVKHATTRAVVYSNSRPGYPIIIIEEDYGEKYPVMVPNTAG